MYITNLKKNVKAFVISFAISFTISAVFGYIREARRLRNWR